MPEITEAELAQLQEARQWANLALKLNSGKTKRDFEKLVKQVAPEIETSDELAEPLLAPMRQELDNLKNQLKGINDGAEAWRQQEQIAALRKAGYTDEGIEKIKGIMTEKGIRDAMDAAAVFDKANPPPRAPAPGTTPLQFGESLFGGDGMTKEKLNLLFENPDAFVDAEINAVHNEFNNQ